MIKNKRALPWILFASELIGTALLIMVGLSIVILDFGQDSPVLQFLPSAGVRRLATGFLFGVTGALVALSPVGRESGAHINPAVTLAFWLSGKLKGRYALLYVIAQLCGATAGAVPLLLWGAMGRSVQFGATVPGAGIGCFLALAGEIVTTFALIVGLFYFIGHPRLRRYTPAIFPFLYAAMVYLEAPLSGTSTNPARSFGPAVVSGDWHGWWIYWLGPLLGTVLGVQAFRWTWPRRLEMIIAKLYHFEHDRFRIFRGQA